MGNELEKPLKCDFSALIDYGCITVSQCALMAVVTNIRGYFEDKHVEAVTHYMSLAYLDITEGRLNAKHPLTHIPYSEYLRMNKAGLFSFEGDDIQGPNWNWLIPLDEVERWIQSKGIYIDLDLFRAKIFAQGGKSLSDVVPKIEPVQTPILGVSDGQLVTHNSADGCFDTDKPNSCVDSLPVHSESDMDLIQTDVIEVDHAETMAALFDSVRIEVLEKMFPAKGKWKSWADHAGENGLCAARTSRAKFNPYKAAMWFLGQGIANWDQAHCYRVLAKNLPARSFDERHLLIDAQD